MSVEAERAVLGSIMLSKRALEDVAAILKPTDFSLWQHGDIFAAAIALLNAGDVVDVVTVSDRLIQSGDIERVGGAHTLHEMTSEVTTAANAAWHAGIVREASKQRQIDALLVGGRDRLLQRSETADRVAQSVLDDLDALLGHVAEDVPSISDEFDDVVASLAEPPLYKHTPWHALDDIVDGFRPGALYLIGARPGGGKSLMGLAAAAELAKHGPVAFSSLEMSRREIMLRLIASRANVLLHALIRHVVQPHQWDAISHHRQAITELPIYIDDRSGVTIDDVRAHVRRIARKGRLSGVVVDYVQLLRAVDSSKPRWEAVGEFSRALKAIAREYQVPVIALVQLNRRTEGGVARPGLGDLRESGNLEQDADVVILLQRVIDPDTDEPGDELEAIVAKNRSGNTGVATLWWEGAFARIRDWPSHV